MLQSRHWKLHSSGDLVYSLCSLLAYSLYLISFDKIIVLQMLHLYVKLNDTIPYHMPHHRSLGNDQPLALCLGGSRSPLPKSG